VNKSRDDMRVSSLSISSLSMLINELPYVPSQNPCVKKTYLSRPKIISIAFAQDLYGVSHNSEAAFIQYFFVLSGFFVVCIKGKSFSIFTSSWIHSSVIVILFSFLYFSRLLRYLFLF
jgi:hypothetical protein